MTPFEISVPDSDLADLGRRLQGTRLAAPAAGEPWESGVDYDYLSQLVGYWRDGFDWRRQERRLNSFPQFTAEIGDDVVHFVHIRPNGDATPIILTHGWPYSFIEFLPIGSLLTEPDRDVPFEVVIPSLPGYGYSPPMTAQPFTADGVARLWHRLMTEVLGLERFVTYGEDVGAGVSDWLGALFPDSVMGIFSTHAAFPPSERSADLSESEEGFRQWLDEKWRTGQGYARIQATRPDTPAVGLNDSPAGLLAWLVEKFHEWSGPGFEESWSADDVLTTTSLYWFTRSIGTSFLPYYHERHEPTLPQISVPVGVSVQWGERGFPREYAERTYLDILVWKELPRGGHFTAKQTPDLVAADLSAFVISLR